MRPLLLSILLLSLAGRTADAQALRLAWRFVTGGALLFRPALDHRGTLYLASADRFLYAVDPGGGERWRFALGSRPSASPVVAYDGTVLAGTAGGRLWAVDPSGRARWSFTAPSRPALSPALGLDGTIYLPAGAALFALSWRGEERWRYRLAAEAAAAPAVGPDGTVYLATGDRRLLALAPTGERRWEADLPGRVSAPTVDADGSVLVGAAGIHRLSAQGALLWSYPIPAETAQPVLRPDGSILAGAANGKMYLLSAEGARLAELALEAPVRYAAIAARDDTVIVATAARSLLILRAGDGALEPRLESAGRFEAGEPVHHAALAPDGSVYLGSEDWVLYCLRGAAAGAGSAAGPGGAGSAAGPTAAAGSAVSAWPMAHHDVQHTGRSGALADLEGPPALALRELALAEEEALKQRALDDLERHLSGERFLPVHLAVMEGVLGALAAEGVTIRARSSGAPLPGYPRVRARAYSLLGELASEGSRRALLGAAALDPDLAARLAAFRALGRIGADPDGEMGRLLSREARRPEAEEALVLGGLDALARVLAEGPGRAAPDDFRALAELAGRGSRRVAERARQILKELQRRLP
jgi:outer membrane protein assembly factor BamB